MADVYIQGIDMVRFGRYPDVTFPKLGGGVLPFELVPAEVFD